MPIVVGIWCMERRLIHRYTIDTVYIPYIREIFVGFSFRYKKPQNEKSTHENLYIQIVAANSRLL